MTAPVSYLRPLSGVYLPPPGAVAGLSDDESALMTALSFKLTMQSVTMKLRNAYYEGSQRLYSLGISIPPQLAGLSTVVDWPRICVDPLVQRAVIDGFRLPGSTEIDSEMQEHWQANNMDFEAPLCFLDSLVYGRGYVIVGAPDEPGGSPLVTVESPLNMTVNWDPRTRRITAAYQAYEVDGTFIAALYLPDQNIFLSRGQSSGWSVYDRDLHNFGEVSVVRFANRARASDRDGSSEITRAVRNTTDSACRSLLGMEIAREFYSIPHRYILGANESDFVDSQGNQKTSLAMAMDKFLAIERDADGQLPSVGQFSAADPSVFTKIIDKQGQLIASATQFPVEWFGLTSQSNPASADAIRSAQDGVNRRARQVCRQWSDPSEDVQRLVWRYANDGAQVPKPMMQLETEWAEVATPTPAATSDAISKQISVGSIPATSDVTLAALGYSALQRAQLAQDRAQDPAQQLIAELDSQIARKDIIDAIRLLKATGQAVPQADPTPVPGEALPAVAVPAVPKATP